MAAMPQIIGAIVKAFASVNWLDVGINIIKGIAKGIINSFPAIADAAKQAAKSALESAKNFLGIHSPSRVMRDQVGLMVGAGMAEGIENSQKMVNSAMAGLNNQVVSDGNINIGSSNGVNANPNKDMYSDDLSYTKGNNQPIFITVQSVLEGEKIAEGTAKYDNKIQGSNVAFEGRSNGL
jgi:phage-related protein